MLCLLAETGCSNHCSSMQGGQGQEAVHDQEGVALSAQVPALPHFRR